ncbi:MAG: Gfo/Idh/MocA family oxidoreductase [Clostridia bacterium]|nr:Gfo/Idh/MocA family oxidoreductase [Clostridia bacterium]
MLNFAVIGRNFVVDSFLEAASQHSGVKLLGVYSRKEETAVEFAKKHGAERTYTRIDAICADDDIDFVYVASPNICHEEQTVAILRSGKHVLVEKPAAPTLVGFERMKQVAKEHGCILMEAMMPVHLPSFKKIKELLPRIGKVRRAEFSFCQYSSRYDKFKNGIVENAFDPTLCNGALMDIGIYCVEMLAALFGRPESVDGNCIFLKNSIDATGTIIAAYPEMLAVLNYSKITNSALYSQIQGEDGCILFDKVSRPSKVMLKMRDGTEEAFDFSDMKHDMYYELSDFVNAVNGEDITAFSEYTCNSLDITDKAREKMNIDFTKNH